ncbi:UNVERIFIED_CONTAM: cytochrome [Sesamum angustifolium]|uniref:Cytochrome n=1 Tax=Sesamum angustifolium TaxID=2727405 RepID=A0AAW2ISU5_9LAMI
MLSREIKKEGKKDFLQVLLELKENEDSEMSMSLTQIKALFVDIVAGGTDTTATTIEWAMAELLTNPKAMANVQNELSEMVGLNNEVEEFHIHKLKYLEAVMKETMRLHPAVPLLLPRSPTQTSTVRGYTVPKRTRVFINVGWIQRDPSIWDNPSEFKPERFLHENEKCDFSGNNFHYLPFGSWRRVCAGLPLAERMLMYVLASLLHSFEWKLPDGETVDMSDKFGLVLRKSKRLLAIPSPRLSEPNLYA